MNSKNDIFSKLNKKIGSRIMVHAYKFNGWLYRSWEYPVILEVNEDYVVLGNEESTILSSKEGTNHFFFSKVVKPTFWFFFKDKWFNLITTSTPNGYQNYINISSPFIFEESAFKYIDLDLDFKIFPNGNWIEVDINEFMVNQVNFRYPPKLVEIAKRTEDELINMIKNEYFKEYINDQTMEKYNQLYLKFSERGK